jgi:DNA (cytosine-5)-methyltransferase 1
VKLLDLFSGIGGFSLGFERAGFETVAFSEVEPFPCKVLAHRWPEVPNLGDVAKIDPEEVVERFGRIDVISGGFPCQDLSVAGKRAGLAGGRSGLFWEIVRLASGLGPAWLVLENVPGLLSSNEGRDFATLLDALGELGYGLAWRVLDAQHFGVPQRRRRIFVVGHLGAPCPPEILFEPEGLRGDLEAGREEGSGVAPLVIKGAAVGREPEHGPQYGEVLDDGTCYTLNTVETHCVSTLQGGGKRGYRVDAEGAAGGDLLPVVYQVELQNQGSGGNRGYAEADEPAFTLNTNGPQGIALRQGGQVAGTVSSKWAKGTGGSSGDECQNLVTHALTAEGHDASEDGTGRRTPLVPLPFDTTQVTSDKNYSNPRAGDPCHPLASGAHPPAVAFALRGREEGARIEVSGEQASAIRGASGGSSKDYVAAPLTASYGKQLDSSDTNQGPPNALVDGMAVRRLTPLECERLQAFPDGFTDIPGASDSARYRALGNGVCVNVVEWIAERLVMVAGKE